MIYSNIMTSQMNEQLTYDQLYNVYQALSAIEYNTGWNYKHSNEYLPHVHVPLYEHELSEVPNATCQNYLAYRWYGNELLIYGIASHGNNGPFLSLSELAKKAGQYFRKQGIQVETYSSSEYIRKIINIMQSE